MREEATECFGASCRLLVYPAAQKSHLLHRIVRDVMSIWDDALPVSGDRLQPWTHTHTPSIRKRIGNRCYHTRYTTMLSDPDRGVNGGPPLNPRLLLRPSIQT